MRTMATTALGTVLHKLRRSFLRQDGATLTDGELLECVIARRDEAAFEALMRRHGPMVLGVCRRVLRNEADAEDAFQATFLVLAKKAASIRPRGMVGNWLYGVAQNTARNARAMILRRRQKEREAGTMPRQAAPDEVWAELQALLDQELPALPDVYRAIIVLCDLEGKTVKEAARQFGWPQGTAATRLARGRALLAKRLAGHGLSLSAGGLAAMLAQGPASAGVPAPLVASTVQAAAAVAAGQAAAVSASVTALTGAVVKSMLVTKLKAMTAVLLAVLALGGGGLLAYRALKTGPGKEGGPLAAARQEGKVGPGAQPSSPADNVRRHDAWLAASEAIRRDPSLLVYYTFQPEQEQGRTLRDQAVGLRPAHNGAIPGRGAHDGTIVGCSWV